MRAESGLSERLISVVCPPEVPYNGAGFRRPNSNFSSSMSRLKRLNFSLVGLLPLLVLAGPAEAHLNLLESRQIVTLPANLLGGLRVNFESSAAAPAAFAAPLDTNLLMALPPDFRSACASMIESWGDIARGTDEWRVCVLFRQADQVWLSFRCASHAPEYENDYD
jgi:hypothetical protein